MTNSMSSPMRRRSRRSMSPTTAFRSTTLGSSTCLRLKASSWRVRAAARSAACWMAWALSAQRMLFAARLLQQHLGVAADDGEQVVEVVGDAAGEPADGLHLLRLAELLLELRGGR